MTIGASVFLLAVGAILKYAVADEVEGVDLGVIGIILMVAGAIGLLVSIFMQAQQRRGTVVERQVVDDRYPPV